MFHAMYIDILKANCTVFVLTILLLQYVKYQSSTTKTSEWLYFVGESSRNIQNANILTSPSFLRFFRAIRTKNKCKIYD